MPRIQFDYFLNLSTDLPENIKRIAIEQGECEETKNETIDKFRQYIIDHDACKPHRLDNEYLLRFLRTRFWKIEPSYKLMCNYYKFRNQNKSYYEKVRPLELQLLFDEDILSITPYKDQCGHQILIYRFGMWQPSKVTVDDIFRATVVVFELGSLEPITQVMGGVGIIDLEDLSLNHVLHLSPSVAQKMIALLVTSMPIRTFALHIVNQNWAFNAAFNIFKPFLSPSMRARLYIHGSDMSQLHKHISPQHLPKRYGGVHDDYPISLWINNLHKNKYVQKELELAGYDF